MMEMLRMMLCHWVHLLRMRVEVQPFGRFGLPVCILLVAGKPISASGRCMAVLMQMKLKTLGVRGRRP